MKIHCEDIQEGSDFVEEQIKFCIIRKRRENGKGRRWKDGKGEEGREGMGENNLQQKRQKEMSAKGVCLFIFNLF